MAQKYVNALSGVSVQPALLVSKPPTGSSGLHFGLPERGANDSGNWKPSYTPTTAYRFTTPKQRGANDTGNGKNTTVVTKKPNG